jgi:lipid II:glycine glycyltransferase (peptidoglycan interpeptide bridge formation enzyme)
MPLLTSSTDRGTYQQLQNSSEFPLWQSLAWKRYQESLGRETRLYGIKKASGENAASALVIIDRTTPFRCGQAACGLSSWDIPRGPLWNDEASLQKLMSEVIFDAKKEQCMTLTYSPPIPCPLLAIRSSLRSEGVSPFPSQRHEQPEATLLIDLTKPEEEILAHMKPKGRYNIGVAKKHGVRVTQSDDVDAFYELLMRTGKRDDFIIQQKNHYEHFLRDLVGSFLLLAFDTQKKPTSGERSRTIAGLVGVIHKKAGIYYYGASEYAERASMAPYLLQWEAMQYCKRKGCATYDLLGIAPNDDALHAWYGVTRFKKQFGGEVVTYPREQEIVLKPLMRRLIGWKRRMWR